MHFQVRGSPFAVGLEVCRFGYRLAVNPSSRGSFIHKLEAFDVLPKLLPDIAFR